MQLIVRDSFCHATRPPPLPSLPLLSQVQAKPQSCIFYRHQVMLKAALIGDRESYLAVACFSFSQEKMDQKEKKKARGFSRTLS